MPQHEIVQCPRCQRSFECKVGSITLCHCAEVSLSKTQKSLIAEKWDQCLCHRCLQEIQNGQPISTR